MECQHCGASFGPGATWEPTQEPSGPRDTSLTQETYARNSVEPIRGSYLARHWRGELSLPVSYWVNGFIVTIVLTRVGFVVPWDNFVSRSPKLYSVAIILLWIVVALTTLWQLVGIWRSAKHYLAQGKSKLWGNLAKIAVVLGLIRALAELGNVGVPQISEYAKIAIGDDPFGTYQIRVLRDATELEVSGVIVFGLTNSVRRTLDAHPTIRIIHLNSKGGRISEARNLRDLIEAKGLTTYTASACLSACTLAYAAGRERLIGRDASLGFHRYSFPGAKEQDFHAQYEKDKQDWLARGFARAFVDKAFATPNNQMWRPSHQELLNWGVINGYPESDDVAVTGFKLKDLKSFEMELAKNPLFSTLKLYHPNTYAQIVSNLRAALHQGRSQAELRERLFPLVQSAFQRRLPYASDLALRGFVGVLLDQMSVLYSVKPALCYEYVFAEGQGRTFDPRRYFSKELQQREYSVMAEVIRSAAEQRYRPPTAEQIERQQAIIFGELSERHGNDIQMLFEPARGNVDKTKMCELTQDLYQTILRFSERESGALLRYMFASSKQ